MGDATTDFSQYSHAQLKAMVDSLNSGAVMKAADPWRRAYDTLKGIRSALQSYSGQATADWEGQASDAFQTRMTKLANSVNNTAEYANNAAVTLEIVSDSIAEAKAAMPDEPSAWESGTDWVGDRVSGLLGSDDADTRQSEAAARKQQAVAVMRTLAERYRNGAEVLKPPPAGDISDKDDEYPPPPDGPTGAGAISGLIIGAGLGGIAGASGGTTASDAVSRSQSTTGQAVSAGPAVVHHPAVTDAAIHGGSAAVLTPPPPSPGTGPGTGIDGAGIAGGTRVSSTGPAVGGGAVSAHGIGGGTPTAGGGLGGGMRTTGGVGLTPGAARGTVAGGAGGQAGRTAGRARTAAGGGAGGESVTGESLGRTGTGGLGARGGSQVSTESAAGGSPGLSRRSGGTVGESALGGRRGAFTEGGTGIGSRSRGGVPGGSGQAFGAPGTRGRKRDKERAGDRPDYLVEDEETWADGARTNPDVVE
ncbi:WXG100 family type VII secretion target [Peterkaempfera griseoplana]|uniref:WXG100 family type VII secretion target n=1 Tax=Peterkaempfera griseoplana TaxID=66896 RepID=UPI0006E2ABC1|nr:WXG100 family type VII secretion target [Peterkaempfera griseoplana]